MDYVTVVFLTLGVMFIVSIIVVAITLTITENRREKNHRPFISSSKYLK